MAEATAANIRALAARAPDHPSVEKYTRVAGLLAPDAASPDLSETLRDWIDRLDLPSLGHFGVTEHDLSQIVAECRGGSMKTNPLVLTDGEVAEIVRRRL